MVGLEARITATVTDRISHWKRYIDDKKTILFCIYKEQFGRTCFSVFGPVLSKYPNYIRIGQAGQPIISRCFFLIRRATKIETTVSEKGQLITFT